MNLPSETVPFNAAAAYWAVLFGATSVRQVMRACGWASPNTAHNALREAMRRDLVTHTPGKNCTWRPRVGMC